jgi:hypothetical protein
MKEQISVSIMKYMIHGRVLLKVVGEGDGNV